MLSYGPPEVVDDAVEDEEGDSDGEGCIEPGDVVVFEHDAAGEDDDPAEAVAKQVQRHHALVGIVAVVGLPDGEALEGDAQQCHPEHAVGADFLGMGEEADALGNDDDAADDKHDSAYHGTGEGVVFLLEKPREAQRERAAEVVDGFGDDGHGVGEEAADELDEGEEEVGEECEADVAFGGVLVWSVHIK